MLAAGSTLGNYKVERVLGEGGMGVVYLAEHQDSGDKVALKVLNEQFASSTEHQERLISEARLNGLVESPYIVKVVESSESDGIPFFAMEYVLGSEMRAGDDELSWDAKLDISTKIAEGMEAAHAVGLIHRDLKPENILLTEQNDPKILDFGLAREIDPDEVNQDGDVEGTLYYLAPEQLCGEQLSAQCDIFSFGTILYELFCGRRPFEGEYAASIIYDILHEEPIPATEINPALPSWMDVLLGRLMAKRPEARFESMAAVKEFIEQCRASGDAAGETAVKPRATVTVVDLKNMSQDAEWAYFCEGFTDDVIRELARRTDLVVSAQPSTSFKRDIGETFNICRSDYVVVGSLMKWQEKVKLSLAVHQQENKEMIWSESYTESADNLFELLARAAEATSSQLAKASHSEAVEVADEFIHDVTAYDFYLKGKSYYQTNRPEDLKFAQQMFTRALEVDPTLAVAHTGLSDVYAFEYMAYYDRTPEKIAAALAEAEKAIQIEPTLPEAHRSLARYYMFTGEIDKSEVSLTMTIELNPKYAIGYRTLGWLYHARQDFVEATNWARKALSLAPTDLETHLLLGLLAIDQGQLSVAVSTLQRAIELGPDYGRAHYQLGVAYNKLGVTEKALAAFNAAITHQGDPNSLIEAGYIHMIRKEYDKAREMFAKSIKNGHFGFAAQYWLGFSSLLQGNEETADEEFNQALEMVNEYDLKDPNNLPLVAYKGMILAGLKNRSAAILVLEQVENDPDLDPDSRYIVARAYALIDESERMEHHLKLTLEAKGGPTRKEVDHDPHFSLS
ncbi:MAG: protein kinase [bacterium]|nr:protein kinase [bacterium]